MRKIRVPAAIALATVAILTGLAGRPALQIAYLLNRNHDAPIVELKRGEGARKPEEARRFTVLLGCLEGCHGKKGGGVVLDEPGVYRVTAPPLAEALSGYTDAQAARLLRFGVKKNGKTAILMPAATFYPLSDADIALVIDYLRAHPENDAPKRERRILRGGRTAILKGEWRFSADEVDASRPRWGDFARDNSVKRGRYLASVICAECHGVDWEGVAFEGSPSLRIAAAYPPEDFKTLMRTGVPIGGRDLGIMSEVARDAFSLFSDEEIADIHAFFSAHFSGEAD